VALNSLLCADVPLRNCSLTWQERHSACKNMCFNYFFLWMQRSDWSIAAKRDSCLPNNKCIHIDS